MAFNNYSGYAQYPTPNYSNYQPYTPAYMQPTVAQPQQPQVQTGAGSNGFVYVNGKEGAKAFILQPNSTVFLMDSDNPYFYVKAANNLGQATIRKFKFEEVPFDSDSISNSTESYLKTEDFKSFENKVDARISALETLIKQEDKNNG